MMAIAIHSPQEVILMSKVIPGFDSVALQHEGARAIYEETKDMTPEQQLAYWQERTDALLEEQRRLKRAHERVDDTVEVVEQT